MKPLFRSVEASVTLNEERRMIIGKAAGYNVLSSPVKDPTTGKMYKEVIASGAFKQSIDAGDDVIARGEHDSRLLLGRSKSGTLRMQEQEDGLYVEIDVPNTTYGNDLLTLVKRGDINGFSFAFTPVRSRVTKQGDMNIVTRQELKLIDVSPVARPAYAGTELYLRSADDVWEEEETRSEENVTATPTQNVANAYKQDMDFQQFVMSRRQGSAK